MKRARVTLAVVLAIAFGGCTSKPITVPPLTEADVTEMNATANFPDQGYRL